MTIRSYANLVGKAANGCPSNRPPTAADTESTEPTGKQPWSTPYESSI